MATTMPVIAVELTEAGIGRWIDTGRTATTRAEAILAAQEAGYAVVLTGGTICRSEQEGADGQRQAVWSVTVEAR